VHSIVQFNSIVVQDQTNTQASKRKYKFKKCSIGLLEKSAVVYWKKRSMNVHLVLFLLGTYTRVI